MDRGTININKNFEIEYRYYNRDNNYKYFNRKFEIYLVEKKSLIIYRYKPAKSRLD